MRAVSPSLYPTLGIRLLQGRLFSDSRWSAGVGAARGERGFREEVFPRPESDGAAVEDQRQRRPHAIVTIVGVVEDTHQTAMSDAAQPEINLSYLQLTPE